MFSRGSKDNIWQEKVNRFHVNVPFLYPGKKSDKKVFLMFSGGIEVEYWTEMG